MYKFERQDTYKISSGKEVFKIDNKVLIRLYQPIIGAISTSLYITLDSEITLNNKLRVFVTIDRLLRILHITLKEFNEAIENLVEIGLVKLRANPKRKNDFLFKLLPLKNAFDFFLDENLVNVLKNKVNDTYFQQVQEYFHASYIDEDEYVDINEIKEVNLTEEEFYANFLAKYEILKDAINSNVKKEVARVKRLFNLKYDQIEIALFNSVASFNGNFIIDLNKFDNYVESAFKLEDDSENEINRYGEELENIKPIRFYEQNVNRTLLPSEIKQLTLIQDTYELPNGVFNAILDYYFHYGKRQMGSPYSYLSKVAETIKAYGCSNAIETMNYFRELSKSIKNKQNTKVIEKTLENKPINDKIKVDNEIDESKIDELLQLIGD